jgi:hypothetical protein
MSRNPNKRQCAVSGCRAWAMQGQAVCASHRDLTPQPPSLVGKGEPELPSPLRGGAGEDVKVPPLTADYTLDDLAVHAALALNRLQEWYAAHAGDDDPRVVLAYVQQLYHCLARLADLWKQRASMGESELAAALNGALKDLKDTLAAKEDVETYDGFLPVGGAES